MYSLILPELIVDVFKETGNKNIIKHFLDEKKLLNLKSLKLKETTSQSIIKKKDTV